MLESLREALQTSLPDEALHCMEGSRHDMTIEAALHPAIFQKLKIWSLFGDHIPHRGFHAFLSAGSEVLVLRTEALLLKTSHTISAE